MSKQLKCPALQYEIAIGVIERTMAIIKQSAEHNIGELQKCYNELAKNRCSIDVTT